MYFFINTSGLFLKKNMRNFLKKLHKCLSIPVGIIITIVCLSGAILVFQEEILQLANPSHYFVKEVKDETIPLDKLIPMVNAQLDSNSVVGVQIFQDGERTYTMSLKEGFRVSAFVNPYTGEVTGIYKFRESPFFTIMSLHRWLMDGTRTWGKYTVGISTLLFVLILVSGFIIWMPRRMNKSRLKIELKKGKRRLLYDLHNVLGVYACLVLLVCALTGMMWSFDWYRNGVFRILGAEAPKQQEHGARGHSDEGEEEKKLDVIHWQKVLDTLKVSNPDYEYIRVEDGSAAIHLQSSLTSRATDKYSFDNNSGEIIKTVLFKDQEKTTKIWAWVYSLHVGNYWGIWSKIFTCFFALVGASLPITGYCMFFAKRKRKAQSKLKNKDIGS